MNRNQAQIDCQEARAVLGTNSSFHDMEVWLVNNRGYVRGRLLARCGRGGTKVHTATGLYKIIDGHLFVVSASIHCGSRQFFSTERDFQVYNAEQVTCQKCKGGAI